MKDNFKNTLGTRMLGRVGSWMRFVCVWIPEFGKSVAKQSRTNCGCILQTRTVLTWRKLLAAKWSTFKKMVQIFKKLNKIKAKLIELNYLGKEKDGERCGISKSWQCFKEIFVSIQGLSEIFCTTASCRRTRCYESWTQLTSRCECLCPTWMSVGSSPQMCDGTLRNL